MVNRKRQYGEVLYAGVFSFKTNYQRASWSWYTAESILTKFKNEKSNCIINDGYFKYFYNNWMFK